MTEAKNYYSGPKKISCFHCGGKLIPTNDSDVMVNMDLVIDIQIYRCIDCGMENKIAIKPEPQLTVSDEIPEPGLMDEKHNHPRA